MKEKKVYTKRRINMRTFLVACAVTLILLGAGVAYIVPKAWATDTNEQGAIRSVDEDSSNITSSAEGDITSDMDVVATNNPGHTWSDEEHMDSSLTSAPAVASWAVNRLDVFYKGRNNHLWHRSWDGRNWGGEEDLNVTSTAHSPAAVSRDFNSIDVFYVGEFGRLKHISWDGTKWSVEQDIGGELFSAPAVSSWHDKNRLDVFYRGRNNHLWHRSSNDGGVFWSPEEDLTVKPEIQGRSLLFAPAAVSRGFNRIDVFYTGDDNHLKQVSWDGKKWIREMDRGGRLTEAPAVASWAVNRLDVFYRGRNNHLWHRSWNGRNWGGEEDLTRKDEVRGSDLTSAPAAVSRGFNSIDVFYRGKDIDLNNDVTLLKHIQWIG